MKLKIIDENKIILPCKSGDTYYTIERVEEHTPCYREDHVTRQIVDVGTTKTVGKKIVEHKWRSYTEIVQALEVGRVGNDIFLAKEDAESKFEKYWEKWW